jgi:hypothetical protein
MKNHMGQMKIQQMVFMILAVTVFFVLVGVLVLSIMLSGIKETAKSLSEESSMMLVSKLANSPEFTCGGAFTAKTNCIDLEKVILLNGNQDYRDFWGVAKIEIRRIYPDKGDVICNAGNLDNCGIIEVLSKDVKTLPYSSNFVSLCIKDSSASGIIYDRCEVGLLMISAEDKGNG